MPTAPTYPGVYLEEVPSGVRPITGVATSTAAFLGYFSRGPMNEAVRVLNLGDFRREFGGLTADSEAAYALEQFFLNGGTRAWVVRTATGAETAAVVLQSDAGNPNLEVSAASPGVWGDRLRLDVDYATTDPSQSFNLTVTELDEDGNAARTETFRNLTMTPGPRHVAAVVNDGSEVVRVSVALDNGVPVSERPAATGTISDLLIGALPGISATATLTFSIGGSSPQETAALGPAPATLAGLARRIQELIRAKVEDVPAAAKVTVSVAGDLATGAHLVVKAGSGDPADIVTFATVADDVADELDLDEDEHTNVERYVLGGGDAGFQQAAAGSGQKGGDGTPPGAGELIAALAALDRVDVFNLLAIPDTVALADTSAAAVMAAATAYCEKRRAFYLVDVPQVSGSRADVESLETWLGDNGNVRHKNAALYHPRPMVADALAEFRLRPVAASGTVAGLYARTDTERGVWKAPAGTEAALAGVQRLEYKLNDEENGVLNPLGVNCLRSIPPYGNIAWGARTLAGADQTGSEWKYVPVRRTALFLEETLSRGLQWVVFEPNDEPLWAQIRLNVSAFMQGLFLQGAFQGATPREAYLVKCDQETTTQADVDRGIVNIVVGFAPLKPAEFVIIQLQQLAGQTAA